MANQKISGLQIASPATIQDNDSFVIARNGTTRRLTGSVLLSAITTTAVNAVSLSRYAKDIGNNFNTRFDIEHGLGTRDVQTQIYSNTSYRALTAQAIENTSTSTVSLSFTTAPGLTAYRVVIIG